jgi:acyl-CoA synthetase (NDP forming)
MVETPADLFDAAEVMARSPRPAGGRTAVVSHSGGMAILLSDLAERSGVDLPLPRPELARRLDPLLELGAAENPLDMGGIIGGPHRFGQVVEAFVDSDDYDMVLAVTTAHPPTHTLTRAEDLAAIGTNKPLIHLWLAGDLGDEGLASLRAAGTPVSEEPRAAMAALAGLGRLAALREEGPPGPEVLLEVPAVVGTASEHEAKGILAGLGVPVVEGELARSGEEAVFMARRLGYPVVVKVSSRQIAHKTEIEGLLTGVTDEAGVLRAFDQVMAAGRSVPGAAVDGVRVERQRRGLEMIVGAVRDPTFGPTVLVGFGGTYAEALDDVGVAPAPITSGGAMRMISMLQGHRVLSAPRRGTPPDLEGLSRIIVRLGEILCSSDWAEIEINPLVWTGEAWEALDALVRGPDRLGPSGS